MVFAFSAHSTPDGGLSVDLWGMTLGRGETLAIFAVLTAASAVVLLGFGARIQRRFFEPA
jgi:hypothetical protein